MQAGRTNTYKTAPVEPNERSLWTRANNADSVRVRVAPCHPWINGNHVPLSSHISHLLTAHPPHSFSVVETVALRDTEDDLLLRPYDPQYVKRQVPGVKENQKKRK